MKITLSSIVLFLCAATFGFAQGSLTPPPGAPAPTMKSLQQLSDQVALLQSPNKAQKFNAFAEANSTGSQDTTCAAIPISAGTTIKLKSVAVTTYGNTAAAGYIKFLAKTGSATSRTLVQNIPLVFTATNSSDPGPNTRAGFLQIAMWVNGGSVADVGIGDVHSLSVCFLGDTGTSMSVVVTGTIAP